MSKCCCGRELLDETLEAVSRRFGSSVLIAAQDMTFVNLASFLSQCVSSYFKLDISACLVGPCDT